MALSLIRAFVPSIFRVVTSLQTRVLLSFVYRLGVWTPLAFPDALDELACLCSRKPLAVSLEPLSFLAFFLSPLVPKLSCPEKESFLFLNLPCEFCFAQSLPSSPSQHLGMFTAAIFHRKLPPITLTANVPSDSF